MGPASLQSSVLRDGFADVPIIVVTVYEDRDYCYKALEAGATDFLLSPVDHLEFRARARKILTLRRQQRLLAEHAADLERELHDRRAPEGTLAATLMDCLPSPSSVSICRVGFVNRAHEAMFAVDRNHVLGLPLADAHGEEYATRHGVLNDKVIETAADFAVPRLEAVAADGRQHSVVYSPRRRCWTAPAG